LFIGYLSLITSYLRLVTCHFLIPTYDLRLVTTYHSLPATYDLRLVTCYLLLVTCHLSRLTNDFRLITYHSLPATYDLLLVTCDLSLITAYLRLSTYYVSLLTCDLRLITCYPSIYIVDLVVISVGERPPALTQPRLALLRALRPAAHSEPRMRPHSSCHLPVVFGVMSRPSPNHV